MPQGFARSRLTRWYADAPGAGNLPYARLPVGSGSWDVGAGQTLAFTQDISCEAKLYTARLVGIFSKHTDGTDRALIELDSFSHTMISATGQPSHMGQNLTLDALAGIGTRALFVTSVGTLSV